MTKLQTVDDIIEKMNFIIRHPNRNTIDNIVINYVILQKDTLTSIRTILEAAYDNMYNDNLTEVELNTNFINSLVNDINNIYNILSIK